MMENFKPENNQLLKLPEELFEHAPSMVNTYMEFASPLSDTPDEFLLMPFLAMTGALIGRKRYIVAGGSKKFPIIWTVLFAGSSTMRKSTAISIAKKPFNEIDKLYDDQYQKELNNWKEEKRIAKNNDEEYDRPCPKRDRLFAPDGFSDLTFWETLRDNGSIVSIASEFTGLWTELNRPTANIAELALKLFDGEGGRRVTRSGGDITLKEPVWCMVGATTIENFRSALTSVQRDSGFLQRIIPVCIEDSPKAFKPILETQTEDKDLKKDLVDILKKINSLDQQEVNIEQEAIEMHNEWSTEIHRESEQKEDKISDIGGYFTRLSIYGLKIALIFQMFDDSDEKITRKNMKAALILCDWIKCHILYMLNRNYIFDQLYAARLKVREIIQNQPENEISRTKLMNHSHFTKDKLDKIIKTEIESEKIGRKIIETEGKNRTEYYLK